MKKINLILFLIIAILTFNCQTTIITIDDGIPQPTEKPTEKKMYHTVGFGIYDVSKSFDSGCAGKVNQVTIRRSYLDIAIFLAINPFYSPRTIEVYCK